jgi:hypothetical protein
MKQQDVRVGGATVPRHVNGGWALPGREVTYVHAEAVTVATEMAKLMGESAPMTVRELALVKSKPPVNVVRRSVHPSEFRAVHSRV